MKSLFPTFILVFVLLFCMSFVYIFKSRSDAKTEIITIMRDELDFTEQRLEEELNNLEQCKKDRNKRIK